MKNCLVALVLLAAIRDRDNQGRWEKRVESGPDKEVPGFLVNLGPAGARAVLTEKTFVVRDVFKGAPADGKLRPGDVITGVGGKPFSSHTFGGEPHGYEGPILDLGDAIDRAEGKDGKLTLNLLRGATASDAVLSLETIGSFSTTFPSAYKAIGAKSYGKAAGMLKSAGPGAAPMTEYLDGLAGRALEPLAAVEDKVDLERAIALLRKTWAGVARFDRESKELLQRLSK